MIEWIALSLLILLFLWTIRETFVDTEFKSSGVGVSTAVQRPPEDTGSPAYAAWKSKVDAQVPIGANDDDYITVIRAFSDKAIAAGLYKLDYASDDRSVRPKQTPVMPPPEPKKEEGFCVVQ